MVSFGKSPRLLVPKLFFFSSYCTRTQSQTPPFPSFRAAKSAILSESNPEKLAEIFEKCAHFPTFQRHRPIYHLSIRKLARANRPDLIERVLQTQKNSLTPTANSSEGFWIRLMMLYSSAGMVDDATRTLHHMKACQLPLSEKSLCAVLAVHHNNRLFEKVRDLFKTLPLELNVSPGVACHNLVLKSFVEENDVEAARNWVEKMDREGEIAPNIESYNTLLGANLKNGDLVGFDGIVKQIMTKELEFNLASYNYRISRLCKSKECARAKKLLDEMVLKGVKPNAASYNTVIDGFCRVGDSESARKVLEKMVTDGYVSPSSYPYYKLMWNGVKEGEFDLALETCKDIIRRRWVPPFKAVEALVQGLAKMSRVEEAKEVVEKMKRRLRGPAADSWGRIEAALPL